MRNINATETIELTEVHFEDGLEFNFTGSGITSLAPGERVLIVRNQAAFEARYGTDHSDRIAGEFAPLRLENDGERLHLVNGNGATIADFTFNDKAPWPEDAGITGYSLVLNSFAMGDPDYANPSNWRSSVDLGGSPNASDSSALVGEPGEDADGDSLEKLLEHALGTSDQDAADGTNLIRPSVQEVQVDDTIANYLTITFPRDLAADDVEIKPELGVNLAEWRDNENDFVLLSSVNQGDGTALVTYRTTAPIDPATIPEAFVRLRATTP